MHTFMGLWLAVQLVYSYIRPVIASPLLSDHSTRKERFPMQQTLPRWMRAGLLTISLILLLCVGTIVVGRIMLIAPALGLPSFGPPKATLHGVTAERAVAAADGVYEQLELDIAFTTHVAGHFELTGSLVDPTGAAISQVSFNSRHHQQPFTAGNHVITLTFAGERIRAKGRAGPYTLAYLAIRDDETDRIITRQRDSYTTAMYELHEFAGPLWKVVAITEEPVDTNGDGRFDQFDIHVTLDTLFDNEAYLWNAKLFASNIREVAALQTSYEQVPRGATLTLRFDGAQIRRVAADGPYKLQIHARTNEQNPNTPHKRSITIEHTTRPYAADTFGNTAQCDQYEHNDTLKTARPIEIGMAQTHAMCSLEDADWTTFAGEAGQMYRVILADTLDGTALRLNAFDLLGHPLEGVQTAESLILNPLPATGQYYLQVEPTTVPAPGSAATYTLYVERVACPVDDYEPNNLYYQARPLPFDTPQTRHFCTMSDVDWFTIELDADVAYRIETFDVPQDVAVTMALYAFGGTAPLQEGTSQISGIAAVSGRYHLRVQPQMQRSDAVPYQIRIVRDLESPPPPQLLAPPASPDVLVLHPVADSSYLLGNTTANPFVRIKGLDPTFMIQGVGNTYGLLRFQVEQLPYAIASAHLRLYVVQRADHRLELYSTTPGSWQEIQFTGVYEGDQPISASGFLIETLDVEASGTWVEFDVTHLVYRTGEYNFALQTGSIDEWLISSREGAFPPQLVITPAAP
jgi:hypothetical protein